MIEINRIVKPANETIVRYGMKLDAVETALLQAGLHLASINKKPLKTFVSKQICY